MNRLVGRGKADIHIYTSKLAQYQISCYVIHLCILLLRVSLYTNIEESSQKADSSAPFIAGFGLVMDSLTDLKLGIETNNNIPMLSIALHCCISSYYIYIYILYIYNIVFPNKGIYAIY